MSSSCILCEGQPFETLYEGKIRSGSFGKFANQPNSVLKCTNCGLAWLKEFPEINYESEDYRLDYNDSAGIEDYFKNHDSEQNPRIARIGIEKFRNKVVLDFGCGGGSFLDLMKGFASKTIAVEPYAGYHSSLRERGHEVFSCISECQEFLGKVDIVISFGVIEHIDDPLQYLIDAHKILSVEGRLYIETDNLNDILINLHFREFQSFYYRTVHNWYFNCSSLKGLGEKAGFRKVKEGYRHGFGLSNTLLWLKDRTPQGSTQLPFVTETIDRIWIQMLESNGMAELLHFELVK